MAAPRVAIIMGSRNDDDKMQKAEELLKKFGVPYDKKVLSAHRTPELTAGYAKSVEKKGIKVIIAGAGLAAHLPGVLAAYTTLPVIGVPLAAGSLGGQDALYAIVQMPKGIPVATVGIDNAANAAILAVEILAISDIKLKAKLAAYRKELAKK
jgi:phosphoribosylaminoimidazole carboxylase PurE protein